MDLHEAFTMFVRKYYEGYDYAAVKGANGGKFEYDFNTLDKIHNDIVPDRVPKNLDEDPQMDNSMEGDLMSSIKGGTTS